MKKLNIQMLEALCSKRRINIIKLLAKEDNSISFSTMKKRFDLKGKYIYEILQDLERTGWVEKNREGQKYRYKLKEVENIFKTLVIED